MLAVLLLTELWHLLDVSTVAGHGAMLAGLLFFYIIYTFLFGYLFVLQTWILLWIPVTLCYNEVMASIYVLRGNFFD